MFLTGAQLTPAGVAMKGSEEYKDQDLIFRDQVARFSEVGPGKKFSSIADLPSRMADGEENTGVRIVKVPIPPLSENTLRWGADNPVIRLAEIYYMLAECKWRAGDRATAADLINTVRKRNFANNADPNPVTAANLDERRFLDEWSIEFLGRGPQADRFDSLESVYHRYMVGSPAFDMRII